MFAVSPSGIPIKGSYENLTGCAFISSFTKTDNGLEVEYEGETEIFWDDQRTKEDNGEALYVDIEGNLWRESQLRLVDTLPNE